MKENNMKRKKIIAGVLLGLSVLSLAACKNKEIEIPQKSKPTEQIKKKANVPNTESQVKPTKPEIIQQDEKSQIVFIQKFLEAYTSYTSLSEQKEAIRPFLSPALQEQLAISSTVPQEMDKVTSSGQNISVWHNDNGEWLGLATIVINGQTTSTQVFLIGIESHDKSYLINRLSSPTQE
jgi:aspartate 1-decarboxylase